MYIRIYRRKSLIASPLKLSPLPFFFFSFVSLGSFFSLFQPVFRVVVSLYIYFFYIVLNHVVDDDDGSLKQQRERERPIRYARKKKEKKNTLLSAES